MVLKMRVSDFDFRLPDELIAQEPVSPRDSSRLMVIEKKSGRIEHKLFSDLVDYLMPGDVLVVNDSKVLPARLLGKTEDASVELLLLRELETDVWECLAKPGRKVTEGATVLFGDGNLTGKVLAVTSGGERIVHLSSEYGVYEAVHEFGVMPLPPYIKSVLSSPERYQTVYSREEGSVAAPTAGLHFTPELLKCIGEKGVKTVSITLHVGVGTFRPVRTIEVNEHRMHPEHYFVSDETAQAINDASGRVWCVGTTTVRTLESAAAPDGTLSAGSGWTDIFIYPGYTFRRVDALITNFHLPKSTLLMLVSAFSSREQILRAYEVAVEEQYRFFSFGDAMLIV